MQIAQALWNHGPRMVAAMKARGLDVPTFQGEEILDLMAYLRSHGRRIAAPQFQSAGDPATGRRLFTSKGCVRCHGVFGEEDEIGPDLGRAELDGSVTQLAGRMWNHWPAMASAMQALEMQPPTFQGSDLADVFAFIIFSRYDGQKGDPARGRRVYAEKGCSACHGPQGEGKVGPVLREIAPRESKEALVQRMWNHAPGMSLLMASKNLRWPRLEPQEMADLLAFFAEGFSGGPGGAAATASQDEERGPAAGGEAPDSR